MNALPKRTEVAVDWLVPFKNEMGDKCTAIVMLYMDGTGYFYMALNGNRSQYVAKELQDELIAVAQMELESFLSGGF